MKKITLVWVLCLMACMGATTVQAQTVQCAGFESDDFAELWSNYYGDLVSVVSNESYSGAKSCKLTTDVGEATTLAQTVEIAAGKSYVLSAYCKLLKDGGQSAGENATAQLGYAFKDENGDSMTETAYFPITTTGTWTKGSVSTTEVAPTGAVGLRIILKVTGGSTTSVLFDDASVTEAGAKQSQTITGLSDLSKTTSDADFDLTATASSNLAVTYTSSNTAVATISGSTVHIVGAGTSTITALQAGDDTYAAASDVTATLTVNAGTVQAQNLLQCPGFEDDNFADVWTNDFGSLVNVVSDDHYSGEKSCKLATDIGQVAEVYQKIEVTTGKTYTLSVYNKLLNNGGNATAMLSYAFLDANGQNMIEFVSVPMTSTQGAWVKGSLSTDVAPAGAVYIWFDIQISGGISTSILIDDASLTEASATGLWDVHNNSSLTIVGNPVQGSEAKLTFTEAAQGAALRVSDLTGKTLMQQAVAQGSTEATLSVANLSKGIYLVNYTDQTGKRATVKMIK